MKLKSFAMLALCSPIFMSQTTQGQTLGRSYVEGVYSQTMLNDAPTGGDDTISLYGLGARLGGGEKMDFLAEFGVGSWEGLDLLEASAGVQPYFAPENNFYKILADLRVNYARAEDKDTGRATDVIGYSVGAGAELTWEDILSFIAKVDYVRIASDDDINLSGQLNGWVTEWLLVHADLEYGLINKDTTLRLGVGVGF